MSAVDPCEGKIDLAGEPDIRLGTLVIRPSTCQVLSNGEEGRVEPRVMEVLVVLHRALGQTVTRDQLVDACWDGRAVSDDAVTRAIAKVRQLARRAQPPAFTLETIPRVGFRLVVTPDHTVSAATLAADQAAAVPLQNRMRLMFVGAVAAAVCVALVIYWAIGGVGAGQGTSVAVLPFAASQPDTELVQIAGRARDGVARRLTASGVATVLSEDVSSTSGQPHLRVAGKADKQGDKYVISGAISDSDSGRALWSATLERRATDLVGLDDEFGRSLARVLRCALREQASARTAASLEVLSLLLNACEAVGKQAGNAIEVTQRLVAAAPALAGAHALHAFALANHARGLDHLSEEAASLTKQMRAAASRAMDLNPSTPNAHVAIGIRIGTEARFAERESNLRRALEIDPSHAAARLEYSLFLREVGRLGAALEMLAPLDASPGVYVNRSFLYAMRGEIKVAHQELDSLKVVQPDWERDVRWVVAAWWEDPAVALLKLRPLAESSSRLKNYGCIERLLTALAHQGKSPGTRGLARDCDGMSPDWQVRVLARQGDIDGAYERMEQSFPKNRQMHMFLFYPELKAFRHDPRFIQLAARLGLLNYWRDSNQWPDFCAEPDLPYDCRQVREAERLTRRTSR